MNPRLRIFPLNITRNISNVFAFINSRWRRPYLVNSLAASLMPKPRFLSSTAAEISTNEDIDKFRRTLFFTGLQRGIKDQSIAEYFSSFGEVEDFHMHKTYHGVSKNYGFVRFKSPCVTKEVLDGKHLLQGKLIEVGRSMKYRKVEVGKVSSHLTEITLQKYFSKFGFVESVRFIYNSKLTLRSNHAILTFGCIDEALMAVSEESQVIQGCTVSVKLVEHSESRTEDEVKSKKIIVDCLPCGTITVEMLRDYFATYGQLKGIDLLIKREEQNWSAIVVFHELESVNNVLSKEHHQIDGCTVNLSRMKDTFKYTPRERTLYLENLAPQTTRQSLANYFGSYGRIVGAQVIKDRKTDLSTRCGVVKFRGRKPLDSFANISIHTIEGHEVKVRRRGITFGNNLEEVSYELNLADS